MPRQNQRGLTLIEVLIALAVLAVLAKMALPSFSSTIDRRRVIGAANELSTDLQYTRSLAVSKNLSTTLTTNSTGYTITDSTGTGYKTVTMPANVSVVSGVSVTFASLNGTANAATTFNITSSQSTNAAQISTNTLGRVQLSCTNTGGATNTKC